MRYHLIIIFLLQFIYAQVSGTNQFQFVKQKYQNDQLETQKQGGNINCSLLQINKFHQVQVQSGNFQIFVTNYLPSQKLNLNLYSPDAPFGYLFKIQESEIQEPSPDLKPNNKSLNKKFIETSHKFINQIKSDHKLTQKISSNLEYKHFLSLQNQLKHIQLQKQQKRNRLLIIAIYFPKYNPSISSISNYKQQNQRYSLVSLITSNEIFINQSSLQKYFQYKLQRDQHYFVRIPSSIFLNQKTTDSKTFSTSLFFEDNEKNLIFNILHATGNFQYNVSLIKRSYQLNFPSNKISISINMTEQIYRMNRTIIIEKHDFSQKSLKDSQNLLKETEIMFEIKCISETCIFVTSIQRSSQVKKVIPGIPYIYSINQIQIFQISNPFDLQIFIDVNKKNRLPQYQICSTRKINSLENQCIKQLRNPVSTIHFLQVKQKDDKIHTFGRNHQLLINSQHQEYCYKCSYYIALYAQYDNVQGMITIKNSLSTSMISEGNSVTKILKRNQIDSYQIYGLDSRILFQNFSGQYQIYFQQKDLEIQHDLSVQYQQSSHQLPYKVQPRTQNQNYYTVDLRQAIRQQLNKNNKENQIVSNSNNNKIYIISIQTKSNYPSIFYSIILVNNQSRKISLKDGVPFYNTQTNKVSIFQYLTQNLQTESFGIIIINSNRIQQVDLQIYGNCLTFEKNHNNFKTQKDKTSTLQTLKSRAKKFNYTSKKNYSLQKIQNTKVNLMANRIDIIIEPQICKSYIMKITNNATKQNFISYQILVSFIDSIILTLNNELPGILQYPGKIIQIYEIYVPQKTNLSIMINFCRSAKSRMKIYRNKEALISQNADEKIFFNSQSEFQESIYLARVGVFYVTIQFFGFSNILEYTILVKQHEAEEGFYYVDLSKQERQISYEVKDGRFFSTTYELYFSPIFLKHWNKDIQRDVEYFETNYFILESNSYPLLKRASNCKGQLFSDIVNHHEHFRQVKLQKEKLKFHTPKKENEKQKGQLLYYQRGYYSYEYETNNPLSFLIIVPVIARSSSSDQIAIIRYWQFNKKSRQPYQITQLYNGKIYSVFEHWFVSFIIWAEEIVDFHLYESFLLMMIVVCSFLPLSCCLLICVYRTKVYMQFCCKKMVNFVQMIIGKSNEQNRNQRINDQNQNPQNQTEIGNSSTQFSFQIQPNQNQEASRISLPIQQNRKIQQNQDEISKQRNDLKLINQAQNQNDEQNQENFKSYLEESPLT